MGKLIGDPDDAWRMIDGSHAKVHPHAAAPKGGNQEMSRSKGGPTPRCIAGRGCACEAGPNPYYKAPQLMALKFPNESRGISADCLLAEKGYDSDEVIEKPENQGMIAVMPPRKNRKVPCASSVGEA